MVTFFFLLSNPTTPAWFDVPVDDPRPTLLLEEGEAGGELADDPDPHRPWEREGYQVDQVGLVDPMVEEAALKELDDEEAVDAERVVTFELSELPCSPSVPELSTGRNRLPFEKNLNRSLSNKW